MTRNITITALAAAMVLTMAALSFAGPGYGRGGPGYGAKSAYSQLTPEKQAAVEKIYEKYDAQFTELRNRMWTKQSTLQAMVNGGNADEKKIGSLTADISNTRTQMLNLRKTMSDELVKETGIAAGYGPCSAYGQDSRFGGNGHGRRGPGGGRSQGHMF